MLLKNTLLALALAGASTMPVASAHGTSDRWSGPALDREPSDELLLDAAREDGTSTPDSTEGMVLDGTVAAVDRESGQLIVDTDHGLITLTADPEDVDGIDVGDVIRVALLEDEGD
jgi:hypothetical protein